MRKQRERIGVLPGLPFLSLLPGAVGKSHPILLCVLQHPPSPTPSPVLPLLQTEAEAKEAWPRVQLGLVSCGKILASPV